MRSRNDLESGDRSKRFLWSRPFLAAALPVLIVLSPAAAQSLRGAAPQDEWKAVNEGLGRGGTTQPDGVRKYSFPRSDLKVQLDGVAIKPALALGSWLAFQPMGNNQAMVMGDLVLTHEEVNPVMSELLKGGLTVTALHNHLLRSSPPTMYMHVHGHGDPARLAAVFRSAIALTRTPVAPSAANSQPPALDTAALDNIIGAKGSPNGGVLQYSIPRGETVKDAGMPVPVSMGLGTVINIQSTSNGRAVATGDFVLTAAEVTPVMQALRSNGIEVTALHNHLADEEPRLFFLHFWGNDEQRKLAVGLKKALSQTNVLLQQP